MRGGVMQALMTICGLYVYTSSYFVSKQSNQKICKGDTLLIGLASKLILQVKLLNLPIKFLNFFFSVIPNKKDMANVSEPQ